jgi:hypothetical protein
MLMLAVAASAALAQKIETVEGTRTVHNEKGGLWGKTPKVSLELVRTIGDVDAEDENVAFNQPKDVAVDAKGNIFILDSSNARIQKFGPDGKFLASIGRKGQGPGEFVMPEALDFDAAGNLVAYDSMQRRFQIISPDGKDIKTVSITEDRVYDLKCLSSGLFASKGTTYSFARFGEKEGPLTLFKIVDREGKIKASFGALVDLGEQMTTSFGNGIAFDVDPKDDLVAVFQFANRIEKYTADGKLLWRADRPLNFPTEVIKKGEMKRDGGSVMMSSPQMNAVASGAAVDDKGRIWVATLNRQLKKEEQVQTSVMAVGGPGGINSASSKVEGNTDLRTTDAYKLEVFDANGVLLGELPLKQFVDAVVYSGGFLFLIDSQRGAAIHQFKIVEK